MTFGKAIGALPYHCNGMRPVVYFEFISGSNLPFTNVADIWTNIIRNDVFHYEKPRQPKRQKKKKGRLQVVIAQGHSNKVIA